MVFLPRVPVGTGCHRPQQYNGYSNSRYSYNPFSRAYGRPVFASSYNSYCPRPWFPRPCFPSFSTSFYQPFHYRVASFHMMEDRAFSVAMTLAAIGIGILLCVLL